MTAKGRISLTERSPRPEEVGLNMHEIGPDLVVRLHRDGKRIGFWQHNQSEIQEGDLLVIIEATGEEEPLPADEQQAVVE